MDYAVFFPVVLLTLSIPAYSQGTTVAPGKYRCSAYNVAGAGGSCTGTPALVLNADGTYKFSSTFGQWSVRRGRLFLSEPQLWGSGQILGPESFRFSYDYRGKRHIVTWTCQGCAARHAESGVASVGLEIKLEFTRSIDGSSGFVIVPADAARKYTHNAPLPEGAVTGLPVQTGRNEVTLTTNRNNMLPAGRRYVVFLSWPAESIPVAVLDVPVVSTTYKATLPASLDAKGVLARLDR